MEAGEGQERRALTYDDRLEIERGLNRGDRIAWIARTIGRAPKVVAEEVRRNWTDDPQGMLVVRTRNICTKAAGCQARGLCKGMCRMRCSRCKDFLCNSLCEEFEASPCPRLDRTPFCCNACPRRLGGGCRHPYRFYQAKWAQDLADARRSDARRGIDCDPAKFEAAIALISEGLAKGQSPAHIIAANPGAIPFGVRSLYNYLGGAKAGDLTKLDLPRAVRYKPRSKSKAPGASAIPREDLEGRRWPDFCALDQADRDNAVEMDTVVGRSGKDEQCILTLFLRRIGFQFYILLPRKTARCVVEAIDTLQAVCRPRFSMMFGLVIADRGSEFSDVERIEHGKNGVKRLSLYFCDPMQSQQKGRAERCHEELRRILPKGKTNFEALTCRDMAACMSHVNSYLRGNMKWMAPVEMAVSVNTFFTISANVSSPIAPP